MTPSSLRYRTWWPPEVIRVKNEEPMNILRDLTRANRIPSRTAGARASIAWLEQVNEALVVLGEEPVGLDTIPAGHKMDAAVYLDYVAVIVGRARDRVESVLSQLESMPELGGSPAGGIFLVHGRNTGVRAEVARFIEQCASAKLIILGEQTNKGQVLLKKLMREASSAEGAVVLMTGDDIGGLADTGATAKRARQNVVFEAGLFIGLLGTEKVVFLHERGVEVPSDLLGLVHIEYVGGWHSKLAKELEEWGLRVDYAKVAKLS
jgi:predicted nucleotide-binding protein